MSKMTKVTSLMDLRSRATKSKAYEKLAIDAAKNLGGSDITDLGKAMRWLEINASETDQDGVVAEVNFCR